MTRFKQDIENKAVQICQQLKQHEEATSQLTTQLREMFEACPWLDAKKIDERVFARIKEDDKAKGEPNHRVLV